MFFFFPFFKCFCRLCCAREFQDNIQGNKGKDTIYGDAGNDSISGGKGKDTLYGGKNTDTIAGDDGSDLIFGCGDKVVAGDEDILVGCK